MCVTDDVLWRGGLARRQAMKRRHFAVGLRVLVFVTNVTIVTTKKGPYKKMLFEKNKKRVNAFFMVTWLHGYMVTWLHICMIYGTSGGGGGLLVDRRCVSDVLTMDIYGEWIGRRGK